MTPAIQKMLTQILLTVLQVNSQGRFYGFFDFSGHVDSVDVHFRSRGHEPSGAPLGKADYMGVYTKLLQQSYTAKSRGISPEQVAAEDLGEMLVWAKTFLVEDYVEGEAA